MGRSSCTALALMVGLFAACAPSSSRSSLGAIAASSTASLPRSVGPVQSAQPAATAAAAPAAYPTALELARRHAPLYRFNAYVANNSSITNKSEDYFPMSARGFFEQLASGKARVVTEESSGTKVGTNEEKPLGHVASIETGAIHDSPSELAGDEPGTAPIYVHAYEDPKARIRNPDGSGSDLWYVEYWLFYGYDASRERVFALGLVFDVGGHEGDWELTTFAVRVNLGPKGAFQSSEVVRGYYSGHGEKQLVELADMSLVDDQAAPDPRGAHPVGYVAVGKHATYPEPGCWIDLFGLLPLAIHDEIFLGNGVTWRGWQSRLIDLEQPDPAEFAPPGFAALQDPLLASKNVKDWRRWAGTWGDTTPFTIPVIGFTLPFGESPDGPLQHGEYGGGASYTRKWADVKRTAAGLTLGAVPSVVPEPRPIRK